MSQKTTLQDFCHFLEKELRIDLTTEQWKIYREEKELALINERNQMIDAYYAGTAQFDNAAPIVNPKEPKVYVNEKYGELS
jgi:hypothetical protein